MPAFSGSKCCMSPWSEAELGTVKELCPAISAMPCSQCVYPVLRVGWLAGCCSRCQQLKFWLSAENVIPLLEWFLSLKPGQDV